MGEDYEGQQDYNYKGTCGKITIDLKLILVSNCMDLGSYCRLTIEWEHGIPFFTSSKLHGYGSSIYFWVYPPTCRPVTTMKHLRHLPPRYFCMINNTGACMHSLNQKLYRMGILCLCLLALFKFPSYGPDMAFLKLCTPWIRCQKACYRLESAIGYRV